MKYTKIETSLFANFGKKKAIKFQASNNNYIALQSYLATRVDTAVKPFEMTHYFSVPVLDTDEQFLLAFRDNTNRYVHIFCDEDGIGLEVYNLATSASVHFEFYTVEIPLNTFHKFQVLISGRSIFVWLNNILIIEQVNLLGSGDSFKYSNINIGYSDPSDAVLYFLKNGFIVADLKGTYTFNKFFKNSTDLSELGDLVVKISDLKSGSDILVLGHSGASVTAKNDSKEYGSITLHDTNDIDVKNTFIDCSRINQERIDKEGNIIASDSQLTLRRKATTEFLRLDAFSLQNYSNKVTGTGTTFQLTFNTPVNFVEINILSFSEDASIKFFPADVSDNFEWNNVTESAVTGIKTFFFLDDSNILTVRLDGTMEYDVKELSHRFFRLNYDQTVYLMYSQFPTDLTEVTKSDLVIDLFGYEGLVQKRLTGLDVRSLGIPLYDLSLTSYTLPADHAYLFSSEVWQNRNPIFKSPTKFAKLKEIINYLLAYSGFDFFSFTDFTDAWYRQTLYAAKDKTGSPLVSGDWDGSGHVATFANVFDKTVLPNLATYDACNFLKFLLSSLGGIYYFSDNNLIIVRRAETNETLTNKLLSDSKIYQSFDPKTLSEIQEETGVNDSTFALFYESTAIYDSDPERTLHCSFQNYSSESNKTIADNDSGWTAFSVHYPIVIDINKSGYNRFVNDGGAGHTVVPPSCWSAIESIEDDAKQFGLTHLMLIDDTSTNNDFEFLDIYLEYFRKSIRISKTSFELTALVKGVEFHINKKLTEDGKQWSIYKQSTTPNGRSDSGKRTKIYALPIDEE